MLMVTNRQILLLSLVIHVLLILYAHHVDTHPEQFGGLKYTDVDWRVVTDGASLIFHPNKNQSAQGWLTKRLQWGIGDPYRRATFRYTPLLPLLLSPTLLQPLLGKILLSILSLSVPLVLLADRSSGFWAVHLLWTLNPFVLNITTRGSPEAIIVLLVVSFLGCLKKADRNRQVPGQWSLAQRWEIAAAGIFALAVSWKIYPIIYVPAIWAHLSKYSRWFGIPVWRFGIVTLTCLVLINGALWTIWGQPFLDHTFRYHLSRLDHRHNFSPYYYPIYLSLFPSEYQTGYLPGTISSVIHHPMASFIPQFGLVTLSGFALTPKYGLDLSIFVSTAAFVILNKVCTSQYFTWWIPLLLPILPHLKISPRKALALVGAWVVAQALWLGTAYQLEFKAKSVHLQLWAAGIGLLGVSTWVLGEILRSYVDIPPPEKVEKVE